MSDDRQAVYTQTRWSLADLLPSGDKTALEEALKQLDQNTAAFEELRPQLVESIEPQAFLQIVRRLEDLHRHGQIIYAYATLRFSEDTQDQAAQALLAKVEQVFADLSNRTLFFSLWWKDLPDDAASRLRQDSGDYHYWLEEMRHFKPHTLSEPEEKIINLKNVTGFNALNMLYESMTNRYTFKIKVNGKVQEMTRDELMVYVKHHDPKLRASAYQELYRVFGNDAPILGQMYQTLARDWRIENINLRKFASPISVRNLSNDIPDAVVDTLLEVCRNNTGVFHRFFRLKARWLGMERLRRYDIYAPVTRSDKIYPFQQAVAMVLDSFHHFEPSLMEMAARVMKENHMDSEVRKGKRGGAFCLTATPDKTPWVLVNYQGRAMDVSTLAHELGHAIHSMLAAHHSLFTCHASLPLAETASTFSEMLLVDRLLEEERDEAVRRDLLFSQVDDAYATIQRQAFFALFERQAHDMIVEGAPVDELAQVYLENLKQQFGDSIEIGDEFRWEWTSIPHIYNYPFYVYAYTFGQLLVYALYRQFKQEGETFKPRYLKLLSTGGAKAPVRMLEEAGIDVTQPAFWQGGFDVINDMVDQLEAIPVKSA